MSFTAQQSLASYVSGIGVLDRTSPASVVYKGQIFVFYNGSGNNGIFYSTTTDGKKWAPIKNVKDDATGMNVAVNTSPSVTVFKDMIYLFFNGSGNDGTWCTTFDGSKWSQVFSISGKIGGMGFLPSTSPSATVYNSSLFLFWNGSGNDGIFFTSTKDGAKWKWPGQIPSIAIAEATSPCAIAFNELLYVFWNGRANDGTWYSAFEDGSWTHQSSVKAQIKEQGFLPGTSPAALVLADGITLRMFWVGAGGANQGAWYSDFNTKGWTTQRNMSVEIGGQALLASTSPCTVQFQMTPYVFWVGLEKSLWFSSGLTYDLSAAEWIGPDEAFRLGKSFTVNSRDNALVSFFKARLGEGMNIPPRAPSDAGSSLVAKVTKDWDVEKYASITSNVARFLYVCTARAGLPYLIVIRIDPNVPGIFMFFLNVGQ